LNVVGLPTSLLVGANDQVLERHFGPLNRAQLTRNNVGPTRITETASSWRPGTLHIVEALSWSP